MKVAVKFTYLLLLVGSFLIGSLILGVFFAEPRLRRLRLAVTSFFARKILGALRITPTYIGKLDQQSGESSLIVANHLSYLDVLVIVARVPVVFVTSVEIRDSGLLGWICKAAGCLFVERRSASSLHKETEQIAGILKEGFSVALFPEATTSAGDGILPFRKSLFQSAILAQVDVLPFVINYHRIDGKPVDRSNRNTVYYYGDDTFFAHLFRCLKSNRILVDLRFLPRLRRLELPDRKRLADASLQAIKKHINPSI